MANEPSVMGGRFRANAGSGTDGPWPWDRAVTAGPDRVMIAGSIVRRFAGLLLIGLSLAGCAGANVGSSAAFIDPARYELYDCKQLNEEYAVVIKRELELSSLMAKAEQGPAGGLMAELGYRSDFVSIRARREQIEERMSQDSCTRAPPRVESKDQKSGTPDKAAARQP